MFPEFNMTKYRPTLYRGMDEWMSRNGRRMLHIFQKNWQIADRKKCGLCYRVLNRARFAGGDTPVCPANYDEMKKTCKYSVRNV